MPEPPRKRFQIHLSTAIVLMFVAGALIWANKVSHKIPDPYAPPDFSYGWPFAAVGCDIYYRKYGSILYGGFGNTYYPIYLGIVLNVAVAVLIISFVYFLLEWLIRRHAARKGA